MPKWFAKPHHLTPAGNTVITYNDTVRVMKMVFALMILLRHFVMQARFVKMRSVLVRQ